MKKLSCFVALIGMMMCGLFAGCDEKGDTVLVVESFEVKEPVVYMKVGDVHTIEIINIVPEFAVLDPQNLKLDDNYEGGGIVKINQSDMSFTAIRVGTTVVDIYYHNGQKTITAGVRVYVHGTPSLPEPEPEVSIHKVWLADYTVAGDEFEYYMLFDLTDPAKAIVGEAGDFAPSLTEGQFLKYTHEPIPYTVTENADGTSGELHFNDGEIDIRYTYSDLTETSVRLETPDSEAYHPVTATLYTGEVEWVSPE